MTDTTSAASDISVNRRTGEVIVGFEVAALDINMPGPHGYWIHSAPMTREYAYELGRALMEKAAPDA